MLAEKDKSHTPTQKFVLSSTCPLETVTSFKHDPPRGKAQHALVTITAKVGDAFVVEHVQHLSEEEALQAKESLWNTLLLACMASSKDRKRNAPWSEKENPSSAKRCKVLGRAPTDAVIPANLVGTISS